MRPVEPAQVGDSPDLHIDGKRVTEANAWRFVKARRPEARVHRERSHGWPRYDYVRVDDPTGGAPWCYATGRTAGEAWLKVVRQMVEYDARIAAADQALHAACAALATAEDPIDREAAALRYAAVRIDQIERWSTATSTARSIGTP